MQADEWRKNPGMERNHVGNIDSDEELVEESPLWNKLWLESAKVQDHNKSADIAIEHIGSEPGPLGLKLNKEELLKTIQKDFSQDARAEGRHKTTDASIGVPDRQSSVITQSLKPSKFHAYILRIGTWQWTSRYDGDLIAKFYYANSKLDSKLAWEILDDGLKRKIEIDSANISALKLTCPEGQLGTLEIMLLQKPRFARETNQQPRKSTTWMGTTDFTAGQASTHRRHILRCAPGILNKHMLKLLSNNRHLYSLSQENTIPQQNPYFEQCHSESQVPKDSNAHDLNNDYGYHQFGGHKFGKQVQPVETNIIVTNYNGFQNGTCILNSSSARGQSCMVAGTHSGGLEQRNNIFNWYNSSSQMRLRNPYFEQWCTEFEIPEGSNTHNLYHSYGDQEYGGQQSRELVSMSAGTDSAWGNENASQNGIPMLISSSGLPSAGVQQHINMFNWTEASLQLLRQAQLNISSGTISYGPQHGTSMFSSSSSSWQTPPCQSQLNISSGSSSTRELELRNYSFYNPTSQTLKQQVCSETTDAMVLEKISHDLLDDIDLEPTGASEEAMVMSTINSFSNLLQQDPAAPATAGSSQASNPHAGTAAAIIAPPGVDPGVGSSGVGGGSDRSLL